MVNGYLVPENGEHGVDSSLLEQILVSMREPQLEIMYAQKGQLNDEIFIRDAKKVHPTISENVW